jgi:hypothetical protein
MNWFLRLRIPRRLRRASSHREIAMRRFEEPEVITYSREDLAVETAFTGRPSD